mgnify:CR=1 FL=1
MAYQHWDENQKDLWMLTQANDVGVLMREVAVDGNGDVCVATLIDGGITTLSVTGDSPAFVPMPDRITTNICFGGADLKTAFITLSSTGELVSMDWPAGGLPLNFLNK